MEKKVSEDVNFFYSIQVDEDDFDDLSFSG
jgi:hypothetical protein